MNYKIIPINDEILPVVVEWFRSEPWNLPPVDGGFHEAKGYMVAKDELMLACLFIYTNGSAYASIDWMCLNPNIPISESEEGLIFLLDQLTGGMSQIGIQCVSFYTRSKLLVSILDKAGFWQKRNFTQMTKLLKKEALVEGSEIQAGSSL